MTLIGYQRRAERKNGGIRTIGLISMSEVLSITYNTEERVFSEIALIEGKKFTKYEFREDEAEYRESVTLKNDSPVVTHELRFMLDRMGYNATASASSLINTSYYGLLALILTINGETFLAGYSLKFQKERPLRVLSVNGTTGKQLRDETTEIITLQSVDTDKALPFMGDITTLL